MKGPYKKVKDHQNIDFPEPKTTIQYKTAVGPEKPSFSERVRGGLSRVRDFVGESAPQPVTQRRPKRRARRAASRQSPMNQFAFEPSPYVYGGTPPMAGPFGGQRQAPQQTPRKKKKKRRRTEYDDEPQDTWQDMMGVPDSMRRWM